MVFCSIPYTLGLKIGARDVILSENSQSWPRCVTLVSESADFFETALVQKPMPQRRQASRPAQNETKMVCMLKIYNFDILARCLLSRP